MKPEFINLLPFPKTLNELSLENETLIDGRIKAGILTESASGNKYPIVNCIPRFVPIQNYASGFGFQWNVHDKTQ